MNRNIGGPTLANPDVVYTPPAIVAQTTVGIQSASRQDSESPTLQNSPNPKAKIDSMSCIRESFSHLHLPEEVAKELGGAKRLVRCAVRDVRDSGTPFAGHILN